MIYGGYLKEIPTPWKREFDKKARNDEGQKRKVHVKVFKFYGAGHHYYVRIEEEPNAIWNSERRDFQVAWDDAKAKGREFHDKFNKPEHVENFIKRTLERRFRNHKPDYQGEEDIRWYYKDGD